MTNLAKNSLRRIQDKFLQHAGTNACAAYAVSSPDASSAMMEMAEKLAEMSAMSVPTQQPSERYMVGLFGPSRLALIEIMEDADLVLTPASGQRISWINRLFGLAWEHRPGTTLEARKWLWLGSFFDSVETPRIEAGAPAPIMPLLARSEAYPAEVRRRLTSLPTANPPWFSVIDDVGEASAAAIDILISDAESAAVPVGGRTAANSAGDGAPDNQKPLTAAAVAEKRGVDLSTVTRRCDRGKVPGAQKIDGVWLIPEASLDSIPKGSKTPGRTKTKATLASAASWECVNCGHQIVSVSKPDKCVKCRRGAFIRPQRPPIRPAR